MWHPTKISPFPSDNIDPKKKNEKWGLQYVKAIFSTDQFGGPTIFGGDSELHKEISRWYFGDIDETKYMPFLNMDSKDPNSQWLKSIDWRAINYLAKRVNIAVDKIHAVKFDPVVEAISPNAFDERLKFRANIRAVRERRDFLMKAGIGLDSMLPQGVDLQELPENDEEMAIFDQMNWKHAASIFIEKGITETINRLNFEEQRRQVDFDLVLFNLGRVETHMGSDFMPMGSRIDPRKSIVPPSSKPDFSDSQYRAQIEEMSISQVSDRFPHLDAEFLDRVLAFSDRRYQGYYQDDIFRTEDAFGSITSTDVERVRVLFGKIKTTNTRSVVKQKSKQGNPILRKKGFTYGNTKKKQEDFKDTYKNERDFYRTNYPAVYEFAWVIGMDELLMWRQMPNTIVSSLNEELLQDKIYVPNMRDGKTVSMCRQAVPLLDAIHRQHLKLQQIVATDIPNGIEIDLPALQKVAMQNRDGRNMTTLELIDLYLQRGIIITSDPSRDKPGQTKKPITPLSGGMADSIVHHINLLKEHLNSLDQVTGFNNASLASQVPERQGKGVTEMQAQATDQALAYISNADFEIMKATYRNFGKLHGLAEKYSPDKERRRRIFGYAPAGTGGFEPIFKYDYGITIKARPTGQEWREFYMTLQNAYTNDRIAPEDEAAIRLITNLKEARQYLAYYSKKRQEQKQQAEERKLKIQAEGNAEASKATAAIQLQAKEKELEKEQMKGSNEQRTELVKHQNRMKEIKLEKELERENMLLQISAKGETDQGLAQVKGEIDTEILLAEAEIEEEMLPQRNKFKNDGKQQQ
jgi:hypothetical protein